MIAIGSEFVPEAAKHLPIQHQRQDLDQDGALGEKLSLSMDIDQTPLQALTIPSEIYPPSRSLEQSPDSEEQGQTREWQDGYKPTRRQKRKPRPGETSFRIPMSVEQRKSLGASVRPKELQLVEKFDGQTLETDEIVSAETPISAVARGGTKLTFRAYGSLADSANGQSNDGSSLPPAPSLATQQTRSPERQTMDQQHDPEVPRVVQDIDSWPAPVGNGPKFAWWLAQQISNVNSWQTSNNMASRLPELTASQFYGQNGSPLDRRRQIERQRKAKWREANAEKNRENDLRARVKRQARVKFGDIESAEVNQWIATEVARRRARREDKQISQAAKSGHYPLFADSEAIRQTLLREGKLLILKPAIQEVKRLIIDILFPTSTRADESHRLHSIELLLKAANLRQPQEDDSFQAALASIAQDENVFHAARSLMEQLKGEDDEETDFDGRCSTPVQSSAPTSELPHTDTSPSQTLMALNEALAILSELNEMGDEQQAACGQTSAIDAAKRQHQRHQALQGLGVSESQLEEFLVLMNGGSLEPDPDDNLAKELYGKQLTFDILTIPQQQTNSHISDSAAWDIVNSVLGALLQRCIPPPKRGRRTNQVLARETRARRHVTKVKNLLGKIEISGNRVRSRIESQAISEFYNRLTNFGRTGSFDMSLFKPLSEDQTVLSSNNSQHSTIPDSIIRRKRKRSDDVYLAENSPTVATTLPSATNPFTNGEQVVPPTVTLHPPLQTNTRSSSDATTASQFSYKPQHVLPSPPHVDPQNRLHIGYPQFPSTH